jgi:hypothetical protein
LLFFSLFQTIMLQDRSKNDMCVCCEFIDKKTDQGQCKIKVEQKQTSLKCYSSALP